VDYPIGYVRWTEGRNMESALQLMADGKLKVQPLISHRIPIEQAADAYEVITGKKKESFLGVVLTYSEKKEEKSKKIEFRSTFNLQPSTVKLGVLGAGNFANAVLLPAIKKAGDISLVGVASAGGLHAQVAGKKFGFQYAASTDEEIINDPNINTVAILTRHDSHADLVVKALKAGKNVFVEKPLALNAQELKKIIQVLTVDRRSKTIKDGPSSIASPLGTVHGLLTVGFNRRFSPLAQSLSACLSPRNEPLHVHYRVNAGYIPLNHWTQDEVLGGGRVIGEACHFIDLITFLVGAAPVSVTAHALPDNGKYREDNVSMTFTFPDGSIGVVDYLANGDKSFPKERVEVFCGGKIAVLDDFRSLEMVDNGRRKTLRKAQDKGWINEWKAFARAIREGGAPPIPYEQLIGVNESTFAAVESIRTGKAISIS
jgi:predicted dehydrogenase